MAIIICRIIWTHIVATTAVGTVKAMNDACRSNIKRALVLLFNTIRFLFVLVVVVKYSQKVAEKYKMLVGKKFLLRQGASTGMKQWIQRPAPDNVGKN